MAMEKLGGQFEKTAKDLLKTAVGEDAPDNFPTAMLENMVQALVETGDSPSAAQTYFAIASSLKLAHPAAKELTKDEIDTVVKRNFEL